MIDPNSSLYQQAKNYFDNAGVPEFVWAPIIDVESGFDPNASGDSGCSIGLLQLNRCGGQGSGYDAATLADPATNLSIGGPPIVDAYNRLKDTYSGASLSAQVAGSSGHPGYRPDPGDYRFQNIVNRSQGFIDQFGAGPLGTGVVAAAIAGPIVPGAVIGGAIVGALVEQAAATPNNQPPIETDTSTLDWLNAVPSLATVPFTFPFAASQAAQQAAQQAVPQVVPNVGAAVQSGIQSGIQSAFKPLTDLINRALGAQIQIGLVFFGILLIFLALTALVLEKQGGNIARAVAATT